MKLRPQILFLILAASIVLSACARTTVTSVWKKDTFSGPPMRSVLLLAQTGTAYNRSVWENIIAERMQGSGLNCIPSVHIFPPDNTINPDQAINYSRENGIDGVLVLRHIGTRTEKRYHPPQRNYYYRYYYPRPRTYRPYHPKRHIPYRDYYYPYYGHYPDYYPYGFYEEEVYITPGYTSYHEIVRVESFLYYSATREQVWSMTTQTVDPLSTNSLIADISRSVFRSLRKYGLIAITK